VSVLLFGPAVEESRQERKRARSGGEFSRTSKEITTMMKVGAQTSRAKPQKTKNLGRGEKKSQKKIRETAFLHSKGIPAKGRLWDPLKGWGTWGGKKENHKKKREREGVILTQNPHKNKLLGEHSGKFGGKLCRRDTRGGRIGEMEKELE